MSIETLDISTEEKRNYTKDRDGQGFGPGRGFGTICNIMIQNGRSYICYDLKSKAGFCLKVPSDSNSTVGPCLM